MTLVQISQLSEFAKVLIMTEFSILKRYTAFWICQYMPWQNSECILAGFKICQDSEYTRVIQGSTVIQGFKMPQYGWKCLKSTWICLIILILVIMSHTVHSVRWRFNWMSTERIQIPVKDRAKNNNIWKNNYSF